MSELNTIEKDHFLLSLKTAMETKGINQKELERLTNTEQALISKWVNGKSGPSYESMKKLAEALDCYVELIPKEDDVFETAYFEGFMYGGQMMLKNIIKMMKGLKWYGGDKQKKRTD